ncbi:hypothetical protein [Parasitella parasitica]|uniref:Endonuclease/exonuclease/phosphatase domain-containing protein n=1 Tax=Parasitella parasitica TaxID=35722 RepID=A0A0B7MS02_9FUNG|nr:hypothetical protein [Parasitella parasitica]
MRLLLSSDILFEPDNIAPMLVLGNFNYHAAAFINDSTTFTNDNILASSFNAQRSWAHFINFQFFECTHSRGEDPLLPTFRCGSTQSTVDCIYASPFFINIPTPLRSTLCRPREPIML